MSSNYPRNRNKNKNTSNNEEGSINYLDLIMNPEKYKNKPNNKLGNEEDNHGVPRSRRSRRNINEAKNMQNANIFEPSRTSKTSRVSRSRDRSTSANRSLRLKKELQDLERLKSKKWEEMTLEEKKRITEVQQNHDISKIINRPASEVMKEVQDSIRKNQQRFSQRFKEERDRINAEFDFDDEEMYKSIYSTLCSIGLVILIIFLTFFWFKGGKVAKIDSRPFCDTGEVWRNDCVKCPSNGVCEEGKLRYCQRPFKKIKEGCFLDNRSLWMVEKLFKTASSILSSQKGRSICDSRQNSQVSVSKIEKVLRSKYGRNSEFEDALQILSESFNDLEGFGILFNRQNDSLESKNPSFTFSCKLNLFYKNYKFFIWIISISLIIIFWLSFVIRSKILLYNRVKIGYGMLVDQLKKSRSNTLIVDEFMKDLIRKGFTSYSEWDTYLGLMEIIIVRDRKVVDLAFDTGTGIKYGWRLIDN